MKKNRIPLIVSIGIILGIVASEQNVYATDPDCIPFNSNCGSGCESLTIKECRRGSFAGPAIAYQCAYDNTGYYCCMRTKHVFSCKKQGMDQDCPAYTDWHKCTKLYAGVCTNGVCHPPGQPPGG